jgi:GNAT superfamily N-acetyltransferase
VIEQLRLPTTLETRHGQVTIRRAVPEDLDAIVALIHDDPISAAREERSGPDDGSGYSRALSQIVEDPRNELIIAADATDAIVGTLQLTSIPGLARRGSTRLQVEAVRVAPHTRSLGIGGAMMRWAMTKAAPAVGATLVQLTSDSARAEAHRFYLGLGFTDSHVGFKYRVTL